MNLSCSIPKPIHILPEQFLLTYVCNWRAQGKKSVYGDNFDRNRKLLKNRQIFPCTCYFYPFCFLFFLFPFWPFLVPSNWRLKGIIKSKELLKEMRWVSAEFFEEQVYICTELVISLPSLLGIPSLWTDPPPLPSEKIRERKEVCDSLLLIVFGGRIIFPRMCGK